MDILRVVLPGLFSTVQDAGRFGRQRYGVSVAGAVDVAALAIANRLVGNAPDAAALELTFSGGLYVVEAEWVCVALAGADMPMSVDGATLPAYETHLLRRGDRLEIGPARSGMRACLAVAGGIAVPQVLASRSTHWRTATGGFDGRALRAGDRLPGDPPAAPPPFRRLRGDRRPYAGGVVRFVPGPQEDAFEPYALQILTEGRYRLSPRSDRMAAALAGPALPFRGGFNIVSDGVVAGSIQVPGHGRPLVLLADRQTTGGYPKIGTVITPDLGKVGQRRPNERIVFHLVSADEAEARYLRWRADLDALPERFDRIARHRRPATPAAP